MALAAEGGYDAVVMRDLADQANVAVGTLYNYFTSKDHLLAAAYVEWADELVERVRSRPRQGETAAERVADALVRICEGLGRQPKLVSAILTATNSRATEVSELDAEVAVQITEVIEDALDIENRELSLQIAVVLEHVMHSALLSWIHGRLTMDQVMETIRITAHLLLDPRSVGVPAR